LLKIFLLRSILIFSQGRSSQAFGRRVRGCLSVTANQANGTVNCSSFLKLM
jgi:hypothetical protein